MLRVILKTLLCAHLMNCVWIRIMLLFTEEIHSYANNVYELSVAELEREFFVHYVE